MSESSEARYRLRDMVPSHVAQALHAAARPRSFGDGQIIYNQGDVGTEMYHIVSGRVRLSFLHQDGRELIYIAFEPGDSFGFSTLIDGSSLPHTAEAYGDVQLRAAVAVARKLAVTMHAMLRSGELFTRTAAAA